jgi:hypothetical protein
MGEGEGFEDALKTGRRANSKQLRLSHQDDTFKETFGSFERLLRILIKVADLGKLNWDNDSVKI